MTESKQTLFLNEPPLKICLNQTVTNTYLLSAGLLCEWERALPETFALIWRLWFRFRIGTLIFKDVTEWRQWTA